MKMIVGEILHLLSGFVTCCIAALGSKMIKILEKKGRVGWIDRF